uniref:Uncharacterized protein n=1 Tax=Rhizophora mucronata TaxID=61149 RepID=A0A2P2QSX0_RHIMU
MGMIYWLCSLIKNLHSPHSKTHCHKETNFQCLTYLHYIV